MKFNYLLFVTLFVFLTCHSFAVTWLGVSFKKTTYENHLALDVKGVHPGSGCFTAGVIAGDIIVSFAGKPLTEMSQISSVLSSLKANQMVKMDIIRDGKKIPMNVKLTNRPDDISSLTGSAIGSKMSEFGKNFYQNADKRKSKPKATLLDFWATWCGPCRKTLPILEEIYASLGDKGLEIIGIADESLNTLNDFYQKHKSPYPLYRDKTKELWMRYGIRSVPTLMLLDKDGYIKGVWSGVPNKKALEQIVQETMNQ